jgi:hypothetical protein
MHELGHLLGLDDGGADAVLNKPNHFSVMNYLYADPVMRRPLDYGRIATWLDETNLDETVGIPKTDLSPAALPSWLPSCRGGTSHGTPLASSTTEVPYACSIGLSRPAGRSTGTAIPHRY